MKIKKYLVAFIACFAFFCLYLFISGICNWDNGGGYVVQFLVVTCMASIWTSIVKLKKWKTNEENNADAIEEKAISDNTIETIVGEKQIINDAKNIDESILKTESKDDSERAAPLLNNDNKPLNIESESSPSVEKEIKDENFTDKSVPKSSDYDDKLDNGKYSSTGIKEKYNSDEKNNREAITTDLEKKISNDGRPDKKYLLVLSLLIFILLASVLGYFLYKNYKSTNQNIETTESIEEAENGIVKVVHSKRSKILNLMILLKDINDHATKENRQWIYKNLTAKNYNVGKDYSEFEYLIFNNQESRDWLYKKLVEEQYNVGNSYEEFENLFIPSESLSRYLDVDENEFIQGIYDNNSASEFYNKMKDEGVKRLSIIFNSYDRFYNFISSDFDFIHELYRELLSKDSIYDIGTEASFRKRLVYEKGRKDLYKLIKNKYDVDIMPYDEFESKILSCLFPNIKNVYDSFRGKDRQLGSLYEFIKKMTNKKEREKFYKEDTNKDLKYKTLEQFEDAMKELHLI